MALLSFLAILPRLCGAEIEQDILKLKARTFCINSNLDTAWEETANVLSRLELKLTLADKEHRVIATDFAAAEYGQLIKIAKNPLPAKKGSFTLKITLEEAAPAFTKIHLTLQIRQQKLVGKSEKLLKSRGTFERYIAYQINQRAVTRQFPRIGEIKLGASLIPDLKTSRYHFAEVEENSPAGEADLRSGDELLAIDGREISIQGELFDILNAVEVEKLAEFKVRRGPRELLKPVWLLRAGDSEEELGLRLKKDGKLSGFKIVEAAPNSKAQKAGLRPGDLLFKASHQRFQSWSDYYRTLAAWHSGQPLTFDLRRGEEILNVAIN